ncbi:MAG: hypothetical protein HC862_00275 [Scytonema sp. RU_4_4]|nr:hypothetical protein [Scytonema sp. RU_4_4]NJR73063.1 hypothetical protein [Scytonema sp. CRU_2_7]
MRFYQLPVILGGAIAALVSIAPIRAETATYQVQSGVTSVYHDLSYLSSIGLNLTGTDNTVEPINSNFLVGFNIAPATNFTFSDVNGLTPILGIIEHNGTVTFNNQTTVGNFSVGLDPTRATNNASGLFLKDTVSLNTALFDLSAPETVVFDGKNLTLTGVKLLLSPEFAGILGNPSLAGVLGGLVQIDAKVVRVATVPEGANVLAILSVSAIVLATKRHKLLFKNTLNCSKASL